MNPLKKYQLIYLAVAMIVTFLMSCAPYMIRKPTLNEARLGKGGQLALDTNLRPGEIRAEVLQVEPGRREIRVRTEDGRTEVLSYDLTRTKVLYHEWDYSVEALESGDIIAFDPRPRSNYVDLVRVQVPVQARAGSAFASRSPAAPRLQVIEGTVDRIDLDKGVFELRPRTGRPVTVVIPYNARPSDVESFRRLRIGDYVRLEGDFVNPDSFQLAAFLADDRARLR